MQVMLQHIIDAYEWQDLTKAGLVLMQVMLQHIATPHHVGKSSMAWFGSDDETRMNHEKRLSGQL